MAEEKKREAFRLSPEAKVGLFVLLGIILLVYMSLRLGGFRLGRAEGYNIYVSFDSAAGVDPEAPVTVAGVEVGRVKEITLEDNKARLKLLINQDVKIGKDFTAALASRGLLGEKYVELTPGAPGAPPLEEGEELTRTTTYVDMDKLITQLSDVTGDLKLVSENLAAVLGGPEGEASIRNIVENVEEISFNVNRIIERNDEKLTGIMTNLEQFTAMIREEGPEIAAGLRDAVRDLDRSLTETSDSLNSLIQENRENLKEGVENLRVAAVRFQEAMDTVNRVTQEVGPEIKETAESLGSIARKIDKGEGTVGKLINDPTTADNINKTISGINRYLERTEAFHFFVGYRGEYLFDEREVKSYFSLRIQPKTDKYYLFEVVDDPRGNVTTETRSVTENGTTRTITEVKTEDEIQFSAQIAKRFRGLTLRGGLIENSGGVGADYQIFNNRLKVFLEAFDFDQEGNPHLKAGATLWLNKYFFLTAGYDDFISRQGLESSYVGLGLEFEDDDLKYLFTSAPPIAF